MITSHTSFWKTYSLKAEKVGRTSGVRGEAEQFAIFSLYLFMQILVGYAHSASPCCLEKRKMLERENSNTSFQNIMQF